MEQTPTTNPFKKKAAPPAQQGEVLSPGAAIPAKAVNQAPCPPPPATVQPVVQEMVQALPASAPTQVVTQPGTEHEGIATVSFDDDIKIPTLDKLPKMNKDQVSRVAFVIFNAKGAPEIKTSTYFHYKVSDSQQYSFLAPKNPDVLKKVIDKLGEPKMRFGTVVFRYATDMAGNLPVTGWSGQIYAWIFSTDKFPALRSLNKEWGLKGHDVILTCTDGSNFQKMTIGPAREHLLNASPETLAKVMESAQLAFDKYLNRFMGKPMTDDQILQLLGYMAAPVNPSTPAVNPFGPGVVVGPGTQQTGEFQHLIAPK